MEKLFFFLEEKTSSFNLFHSGDDGKKESGRIKNGIGGEETEGPREGERR